MLIDCPECEQKISDKALSCPHCGYPLVKTPKKEPKPSRRMKLPNGFGRITKLRGKNIRKPYRAMVTIGKDENGRPIGKLLKPTAYFATYAEAYAALTEYNKSPYDLSTRITMNDLFEKWFDKYNQTVSIKRSKDVKRCWGYCSSIHSLDVTTVRTRTIRELFDGIDKTDAIKKLIKQILSMMFDYAVEYEYVTRNIIKDVTLKTNNEVSNDTHHPFTEEEFESIRNNLGSEIYDMIYIQCYTGMRPQELCTIQTNKINLKDWYLIGGMKTEAGKDRKIPIHKNIRSLFQSKYSLAIKKGHKYLFQGRGVNALSYSRYYKMFVDAIPNHKPHDPRKHFITMAKKAGVDEYAIKLIVGHAIDDITESVYTERDIKWLHKELSKIP